MKVSELMEYLAWAKDDDEVCFLLKQTHGNLKLRVTELGFDYDRNSEDDDKPRDLFLSGVEDGYGPSELDLM